MIISSRGHRNPRQVQYLFVDGSYFQKAMHYIAKEFFKCDEIPVDYSRLAKRFEKTFYYDCLPPRKSDETTQVYEERIRPAIERFDQMRLVNGFHVYEGTTSGTEGRERQKKVDIMIAIDMLTHAVRGNMDRATLLTGDLDFKPLIDALVQNGMYVTLWYYTPNTNKELVYAADARQELNVHGAYWLANDEFRHRVKMPSATSISGKHVAEWQFIRSGKTSSDDLIELFEKSNRYLIVYADILNPGHYVHIEHDDLEFLEKFTKNTHMEYDWG